MNKLPGKITSIEASEHFYHIEVDISGVFFTAVIAKMPLESSFIQTGQKILLVFKETEVALGKNLAGLISLRNRFDVIIKKVERKKILCKVIMDFKGMNIVSIITASSAEKMDLIQGDKVECLVKATAMSVMESGE